MKMSLVLSAFGMISLYFVLNYMNIPQYIMLIAFVFNLALLIKIFMIFGMKYTLTRISKG